MARRLSRLWCRFAPPQPRRSRRSRGWAEGPSHAAQGGDTAFPVVPVPLIPRGREQGNREQAMAVGIRRVPGPPPRRRRREKEEERRERRRTLPVSLWLGGCGAAERHQSASALGHSAPATRPREGTLPSPLFPVPLFPTPRDQGNREQRGSGSAGRFSAEQCRVGQRARPAVTLTHPPC